MQCMVVFTWPLQDKLHLYKRVEALSEQSFETLTQTFLLYQINQLRGNLSRTDIFVTSISQG